MAEITNLKVNELDFDKIKANIKDYLKGQDQFRDYNFDASGMSVLLDVLAYNTYYNSFYLNMVASEAFLSTAQKRNSVINLTRSLNYTPRSRISSTVTGDFAITAIGSPTTIDIPQYTRFSGTVDGITYYFNTLRAYTVTVSPTSTYSLSDVVLKEGLYYNYRYIVNTTDPDQRFLIPNPGVDTTTMTVKVINSVSDSTTRLFSLAQNIVEVGPTAQVYFLEEVEDGQFELFFGDGIHGVEVIDGNVISIEYLLSSGADANNIKNLTYESSIPNVSAIEFISVSPSAGGQEREDTERIRFNAPKSYESQNRLVTIEDYKTLLLKQPNVDQVSVWGGEDNDPPEYGKVFIAVKLASGRILTESEKNILTEYVIKPKKIVTIRTELVDPEYIYLLVNVDVKYDSAKTSLTSSTLQSKVYDAILEYNNNDLNQFSKYLRYSKLSRQIDYAERSILNSNLNIRMRKDVQIQLGSSARYEIMFANPIDDVNSGKPASTPYGLSTRLTSNAFTYNGLNLCYLDENNGIIRIYRNIGAENVEVSPNVGTLDYETGKIILTSFGADSFLDGGTTLRITVFPKNYDILPLRDQIITIRDSDITINMIDDNSISFTNR